ncbi:MAG: pilus assembly protein, partial [Lachnospiraceae bacterium]|nr:pilus assembly protein [Lachnospiraceae bacterium]
MLKLKIVENKDFFGPLFPLIEDPMITDIDYNGISLWVTDTQNLRYEAKNVVVTPAFVEEFSNRVANVVSKPFHKQSPVLEAET